MSTFKDLPMVGELVLEASKIMGHRFSGTEPGHGERGRLLLKKDTFLSFKWLMIMA